MAHCRSCRAPVQWCRTVNGKAIPVDLDPVADGNIVLEYPDPNDQTVVDAVTYAPLLHQGRERYVTHFVTCPNANQHRKKPGSPAAKASSTASSTSTSESSSPRATPPLTSKSDRGRTGGSPPGVGK